jgi:hypothetical protein
MTDSSFSKVTAALLAGAVFTAITIGIRDWRTEESMSTSNTPVAQQQEDNTSAPPSNSPVF